MVDTVKMENCATELRYVKEKPLTYTEFLIFWQKFCSKCVVGNYESQYNILVCWYLKLVVSF